MLYFLNVKWERKSNAIFTELHTHVKHLRVRFLMRRELRVLRSGLFHEINNHAIDFDLACPHQYAMLKCKA